MRLVTIYISISIYIYIYIYAKMNVSKGENERKREKRGEHSAFYPFPDETSLEIKEENGSLYEICQTLNYICLIFSDESI